MWGQPPKPALSESERAVQRPRSIGPQSLGRGHPIPDPCHSEPGAKPGEEPAVCLLRIEPHPHSVPPRHHESALHLLPHKSKKEPDCVGATATPWPSLLLRYRRNLAYEEQKHHH